MKLLLTSDGFCNPLISQAFLALLSKKPEDTRVLFIPTASRVSEELAYVKASRQELLDLGIQREHIADIDLSHQYSAQELTQFDAVYVCGGNTFYLLHRLRESGFSESLAGMVERGVVYVGVSAGSVIAGPDIGIASPFDENDVGLKDTQGFCWVEKAISPHFQAKEQSIIDDYEQRSGFSVLRLPDSEALKVQDSSESVIR